MPDTQEPTAQEPTAQQPGEAASAAAPETPAAPPAPAGDVEEGKVMAILSYALSFVSIPFFLIPLITRNNDFALFHAKQCLIIWLAGIVVSAVSVPLMAVCVGFVTLAVGGIFLLVVSIMGLINAVNGRQEPVPVIGKWGEEWFKGLKKA